MGDSRAILGTRDHDDSLVAVQLTVDLKPNLPSISLPPLSFLTPSLTVSVCLCVLNELDGVN